MGATSAYQDQPDVSPTAVPQGQSVVSDTTNVIVDIYVITVSSTMVALFGIITNIINLVVFAKIGFKISMNLTLFALSSSDCLMGCCTIAYNICRISRIFPSDSIIDYKVPQRGFAIARFIFTDLSSIITIYLSIERCLCITFPFTFKTMFTMKQTYIIFTFIFIFLLAKNIPLFWTMCTQLKFDEEKHLNRYVVCETALYFELVKAHDIVSLVTIPFVCQIAAGFCVVILSRALRKSSSLRLAVKTSSKHTSAKVDSLSVKEKRPVKMILLLAVLYVPTSVPGFTLGWVRIMYPQIFQWLASGAFNLYTINNLCTILSNIHGSVTIFVYITFNPGYRQFLEAFI
ncbi:uncharacterized protein LOC131942633 [Physella acuta]|uniref:uncharacterized protein LOC131942633 n=1 Tax=Physella acuta TaxID=109671 RepID=UPI0027DD463B|nr:uncharacterized protein LOC131942633 [Physella acuta]